MTSLAPAGDWPDHEIEFLVPLQQVTVVKHKTGILAMAQVGELPDEVHARRGDLQGIESSRNSWRRFESCPLGCTRLDIEQALHLVAQVRELSG